MLIDISGNSFSSLGNPQDADAFAFIIAASITSSTQIQAIDTLAFNLKQANLWNKIKALYPIVGGNANSHKYNLKDPRDLDAAFRLSFTTGWTHDASGMTPNGTSSYANTFFNPSTTLSVSSGHIASYSRLNLTNIPNSIDIGVATGAGSEPINQLNVLTTGVTPTQTRFSWGTQVAGTFAIITATTDSRGFFVGSQNGATAASRNVFRNGVKGISATNYGTPSMSNGNFFIGALNNPSVGSNGFFFTNRPFSFVSFGDGLTDDEVASYYTIVEAYQTTLGRQVIQSTTLDRPTQFTLPTVTYNPKQIYGNDLYVWVDMTDWRTMYNSATGNTNIPSTGCVSASSATAPSNHTNVRRLEDLAGNFTGSNSSRKFYHFGGSVIRVTTQPVADSFVTGNTNLFANNQLDTNRGFFSGSTLTTAAGNMLIHNPELGNRLNFLAPNSAVTVCNYMPNNQLNGIYGIGLGFDFTTVGWFGFRQPSNSNLSFAIPLRHGSGSVSSTTVFVTSDYQRSFSSRTIMLTGVICGRTADFYINTTLITSFTIPTAVQYPFSANLGTNFIEGGLGMSSAGATGTLKTNSTPRTVWEAFIANSYTSPQQINLLYDYFRIKFKDRTYDLS